MIREVKMIFTVFLFVCMFGVTFCSSGRDLSTFRAASVTLVEMVSTVDSYERFIVSAKKQGAELIAFPEISLGATEVDGENITMDSIPCIDADPKTRPRQHALSCSARDNQIYVVFSLIEYAGDKIYNTAIAIDREGKIISRYRKTHILMAFLSVGDSGPTYFDTDFGVRFGMFICFDILFKNPSEILVSEEYKVTNIIYPQMWAHEPPFDALQVQQSFSEYFQVNLIAANNHFRSKGSGHFSRGEVLDFSMNMSKDALLVSDFPVLEFTPTHKVPQIKTKWETFTKQKWFSTNPSLSSSSSSQSLTLENDYYICNFTYQVESSTNLWYSFYTWRFGGKFGPSFSDNSMNSKKMMMMVPPFHDFMLYEDLCGVTVCAPGDQTPLPLCFNGTDNINAKTMFKEFELSITLKDDARSLRISLASDNYELFTPLKDQFEITHDYDVHTVKMLEGNKQPILSVCISGMLNSNFEN